MLSSCCLPQGLGRPDLTRISLGLEDKEDLIADIADTLDAI